MQTKANGKQTIWVLLIALLLITLCIGGLWVYVKSADAEIGMHEVAVADLPKDENAFITWEKYDNFPPLFETEDDLKWSSGFGLMRNEKERLNSLKAEYANGRRPDLAAPTLPSETGFAILPLDPASYGGLTEYYFLPEALLTDEQILQLIAYGEEKGTPFTADMLTVKNSTRGDSGYHVNRLLSAGEKERLFNLARRCFEDGLVPEQPKAPALPVSGIAYVPLIPEPVFGIDTFIFYPFRELSDEELLWEAYNPSIKDYTLLNISEESDLNPVADNAWMRALLEDVSLMPISANHVQSDYVRKDATEEIRLDGIFESARVNGQKMEYRIFVGYPDKQLWYLMVSLNDQNNPAAAASADVPTESIQDPKWEETARLVVERIDPSGISKAEAKRLSWMGDSKFPCVEYRPSLI